MKPTEILTATALAVMLALLVTVAGVMALGTPAQAATRPPATGSTAPSEAGRAFTAMQSFG